jgi:hypothetical protein
MSRYVTEEPVRPEERYALYRLCGDERNLQLVATCATPEAFGVAYITLGREGELDECPVGCLDRLPEEGQPKWIVRPWLPSARNLSDAGRTLARSKGKT